MIPDQGAIERRDGLRGVSKEDAGAIRARERLFTGFPQISDDGEDSQASERPLPY